MPTSTSSGSSTEAALRMCKIKLLLEAENMSQHLSEQSIARCTHASHSVPPEQMGTAGQVLGFLRNWQTNTSSKLSMLELQSSQLASKDLLYLPPCDTKRIRDWALGIVQSVVTGLMCVSSCLVTA